MLLQSQYPWILQLWLPRVRCPGAGGRGVLGGGQDGEEGGGGGDDVTQVAGPGEAQHHQ